ncbi:MAG: hypothetical protein Q4D35_03880 [Ruminococcus sp.]|nr:hypothetical protein [Ruminococcus sp.]
MISRERGNACAFSESRLISNATEVHLRVAVPNPVSSDVYLR